jgi:hypothetical protein
MADSGERAGERRAILWGGALLAAAALVGHLLAPGANILWLVLLFFGVASVPQAFVRRSGKQPRRDRRR